MAGVAVLIASRRSKLINRLTRPDTPDSTSTLIHWPTDQGVKVLTVIVAIAVCAAVRIQRVNAPLSPNQNSFVNNTVTYLNDRKNFTAGPIS